MQWWGFVGLAMVLYCGSTLPKKQTQAHMTMPNPWALLLAWMLFWSAFQ